MKGKSGLVLKALLVLCYCPLAAEVMLRIMDPVPMLPRYVKAMPYGVRGNEPNRSYWHRTAEYKVYIRTNAKGIRCDKDIPYEKPPGVKRIILLGDSFGMGYGVSYEQMFISRMVHYLEKEHGIKAEVVNLSTSGHGNSEELVTLENEGLKYDPDMVLLAWHPTDVDDNVRSNLYELADGKLKGKASTYLPGVKTRELLFSYTAYRLMAENSQLYNLLRDWAGRNIKAWLASFRSIRRTKQMYTENKAPEDYSPKLTIALLEEIKHKCEQVNASLLILDIPRRYGRTDFRSLFPAGFIGEGNELDIVSPISKFAEAGGRKIYWERSQGHFTPLGCDMVGQLLANHIASQNLLKTPDRSK